MIVFIDTYVKLKCHSAYTKFINGLLFVGIDKLRNIMFPVFIVQITCELFAKNRSIGL